MGEARRRGTFNQRVEQSVAKARAGTAVSAQSSPRRITVRPCLMPRCPVSSRVLSHEMTPETLRFMCDGHWRFVPEPERKALREAAEARRKTYGKETIAWQLAARAAVMAVINAPGLAAAAESEAFMGGKKSAPATEGV